MADFRDLNISAKSVNFNEGTLDTADTNTAERRFRNYKRATYQGDVNSIGTNVIVRLEGTTNGIDYDNLDLNNNDLLLTSNGSFTIGYSGSLPMIKIRLKLVSISGGTPTIDYIASHFSKE